MSSVSQSHFGAWTLATSHARRSRALNVHQGTPSCNLPSKKCTFGERQQVTSPSILARAKRLQRPIRRIRGRRTFFFFFFFFTLVTGTTRSLSLKLSDTRVYAPQIRALLGTAAHLCRVVVLKLRAVPSCRMKNVLS